MKARLSCLGALCLGLTSGTASAQAPPEVAAVAVESGCPDAAVTPRAVRRTSHSGMSAVPRLEPSIERLEEYLALHMQTAASEGLGQIIQWHQLRVSSD